MPPTIAEWLEGKDILITGGTGFVGKVLVFKLLKASPGVNHLYLIVRGKRGADVNARKKDFMADQVFGPLLEAYPNAFDKVTFVAGEMSEIELGLSKQDQEILKEKIHIVFHTAASVRFDEPLSAALKLNTRGTYELTKLAKQMKRLELFEYVSTTYCNANLNETIQEKVYPSHLDWKVMLKVLEKDEDALDLLVNKLLWTQPNTYTMTKCMAENVVLEASKELPALIVRPSVITPALDDPLPGWSDNLNGVIGVTVGVSKGVLRTFKCSPSAVMDYVPVDICVDGIISAAWSRRFHGSDELEVINQAYGDEIPLSFNGLVKNGVIINAECPMENYCWYPFIILTNNTYYYHLLFFCLQLIPALVQDLLLMMLGQKRMLLKLNIKIYNAAMALSDFSERPFKFANKKLRLVGDQLHPKDREIYRISMESSGQEVDVLKVMMTGQLGIKRYFFKEKDEDLPKFKRIHRILYYIDRLTRTVLVSALAWKLWQWSTWLLGSSTDPELLMTTPLPPQNT